jgi:hypothetical protein
MPLLRGLRIAFQLNEDRNAQTSSFLLRSGCDGRGCGKCFRAVEHYRRRYVGRREAACAIGMVLCHPAKRPDELLAMGYGEHQWDHRYRPDRWKERFVDQRNSEWKRSNNAPEQCWRL